MRAESMSIDCDVFAIIGADRCVEWPFGDCDMVLVDWGIGNGLTY